MNQKNSQKSGGIEYLSDTEDSEREQATNITPKTGKIRNSKSSGLRSSERLQERHSRVFKMPSRDDVFHSIESSKTPSKSLMDYKPLHRVNNFMRGTHRYNADELDENSTDGDEDFINDDQEEDDHVSSGSDSSESPRRCRQRTTDDADEDNVPSKGRRTNIRAKRSIHMTAIQSTEPCSTTLADSLQTPMMDDEMNVLNSSMLGRKRRRLFSGNNTSSEEESKNHIISDDEEGVDTTSRRNSLDARTVIHVEEPDNVGDNVMCEASKNDMFGYGLNVVCRDVDKGVLKRADASVSPPISPIVRSPGDLLTTEDHIPPPSIHSLFGTPASSGSSDHSGNESDSSSTSSSDDDYLALRDRPAKRAKHLLRKKQPKRRALDMLQRVRCKKMHAISAFVVDD